jgi:hypothetical protein
MYKPAGFEPGIFGSVGGHDEKMTLKKLLTTF